MQNSYHMAKLSLFKNFNSKKSRNVFGTTSLEQFKMLTLMQFLQARQFEVV